MKFRKCHAVVVVLALSATGLWAAAAGEDDAAATAEREMIRNARGEMQEKPQYGGSIGLAMPAANTSWDPATGGSRGRGTSWLPRLGAVGNGQPCERP